VLMAAFRSDFTVMYPKRCPMKLTLAVSPMYYRNATAAGSSRSLRINGVYSVHVPDRGT